MVRILAADQIVENIINTPASAWLENQGIPFRLFIHLKNILNLEQAALERNQTTEQIIRSILFRLSKNEFILVVAAGTGQISWKALRSYLNTSRISLANDQEVERITGARPGAVSPFGLPGPVRILADPNIFNPDEVSMGSGVLGAAVILTKCSLKQALGNVEIVRLIYERGEKK